MSNSEKINIKARINRHLRISRQSGLSNKSLKLTYSLAFVIIFVVFLVPVYPSLAKVFYNNTETDFYRGDIDEGSILNSYYATDKMVLEDETYIKDNLDSFVSVNTILDSERTESDVNEIIKYTVKPGESYDSIAHKFGVSVNTILWANNFTRSKVIHPGNVIKIPTVTGLLYTVKKGDNLQKIASKYKIKAEDIKIKNSLTQESIIKVGQQIILPGAKKIIPKPKPKPKPVYTRTTKSKTQTRNTASSSNTSRYTTNKGTYKLVWRKPKWKFYWGNCTRYVAQYKNVTWGGNANRWMANARKKGVKTGKTAQVGAIVQFTGRGYNPIYGHVGIVMEIKGNKMIVSDMNYRRLNEVTYRSVSLNDRTINGYIYVN